MDIDRTRYVALRLSNGQLFQLRHLPKDLANGIAREHNVSWLIALDMPQANAEVLEDLAKLAATVTDTEPPHLETWDDVLELAARLVIVDSDGRPVPTGEATDPDRIAWAPPAS